MVAAGAIAADPAGDLVAQVPASLPELLTERAELADGRVERPAVIGGPGFDRAAEVVGRPAGEGRPAHRDRLERVGVAVAEPGETVLVREADDPAMPRLAEARRVERLEPVGVGRPVRVVEEPAEHPALGAQRIRDERMGRDGQPARVMDRHDRRAQRAIRPDRPVDVQREQVAAERRHLFADDDLGAHPAVDGHRPPGQRGIDPLVVGDGDDGQVRPPLDVVEDRLDGRGPVAGRGVDVEVGATDGVAGRSVMPPPPAPRRRPTRGRARSGRRSPTTGRARRR